MTDYAKYPFVRMLIPFALGIWCCVCMPAFRLSPSTTIIIALVLFALASVTAFVLKSYRNNWVFGAVMGCYLALAGYVLTQVHEAEAQKDYFRTTMRPMRNIMWRVFTIIRRNAPTPSERFWTWNISLVTACLHALFQVR